MLEGIVVLVGLIGWVVASLVWLFQPCRSNRPTKYHGFHDWMNQERVQEEWCQKHKQKWLDALKKCPVTHESYLVIGGGFLGSKIISGLLLRGEDKITVMDVSNNVSWVKDSRVKFVQGDITKYENVLEACKGVDVVFATAAAIRFMDSLDYQYDLSHRVNVIGMKNIVRACQEQGVRYLIQTSTVHVTVTKPTYPVKGDYGVQIVDEGTAYVTRETATSFYALSKSLGEKCALQGNGRKGLQVVSIRPCSGIFGAKDQLLVEPMLRDKMYMFLGFRILIDWVYVDNVAFAHLLAEQKLRTTPTTVAGKAFCVSNDEAMSNDDFRYRFKHFFPELKIVHGSPRLLWLLAYAIEIMQRILKHNAPALGKELQYVTPTAFRIMNIDFVLKSTYAQQMLAYEPIFTVDEGIQLSILEHQSPSRFTL